MKQKIYVFEAKATGRTSFVPIKAGSILDAIKIMKTMGWKHFNII